MLYVLKLFFFVSILLPGYYNTINRTLLCGKYGFVSESSSKTCVCNDDFEITDQFGCNKSKKYYKTYFILTLFGGMLGANDIYLGNNIYALFKVLIICSTTLFLVVNKSKIENKVYGNCLLNKLK